MMQFRWLFLLMIIPVHSICQLPPLYQNLPPGNYSVGFKIFTLTDDSRIISPEFNYLGEKNAGDRRRTITIHLWYPANAQAGRRLTYADYCISKLLNNTGQRADSVEANAALLDARNAEERWFGKIQDDNDWQKLLATEMLATVEAPPLNKPFPFLIGMLRPVSTTQVNELLAKIIAYNLTVVIHEMYENGISPSFQKV